MSIPLSPYLKISQNPAYLPKTPSTPNINPQHPLLSPSPLLNLFYKIYPSMQANIHDYYSDSFILIDLSKRRLRDVATVNEALDEVLPRVNKELTLAARKDEGVEEEKEAKQRDYSVIGINMAYNEIDFVMEGENRDKLIEIVIERVQRVFSEANEGVKEEDVPIREIYLSVNDIEEIPPCLSMVKNTLEKLILSRNAIKWAESSETLKSLVNLRHLELQGNLIKRIQYEDINALEKLEYLSLS